MNCGIARTALLTATAMLDGKLPVDKSNLRGPLNALDDIKSIVATVPKYDWTNRPLMTESWMFTR